MGKEPVTETPELKRMRWLTGLLLIFFLGGVIGVAVTAIFPPRSLNTNLRNVLPRLEKEVYGLEGDGTNPERLELLKELKGLIGTQFKRTGFQTEKAHLETTGNLEDHLRFALRSLERELKPGSETYNPGEGEFALPPGSEKVLRKLKRMKAVIELVLNG